MVIDRCFAHPSYFGCFNIEMDRQKGQAAYPLIDSADVLAWVLCMPGNQFQFICAGNSSQNITHHFFKIYGVILVSRIQIDTDRLCVKSVKRGFSINSTGLERPSL